MGSYWLAHTVARWRSHSARGDATPARTGLCRGARRGRRRWPGVQRLPGGPATQLRRPRWCRHAAGARRLAAARGWPHSRGTAPVAGAPNDVHRKGHAGPCRLQGIAPGPQPPRDTRGTRDRRSRQVALGADGVQHDQHVLLPPRISPSSRHDLARRQWATGVAQCPGIGAGNPSTTGWSDSSNEAKGPGHLMINEPRHHHADEPSSPTVT